MFPAKFFLSFVFFVRVEVLIRVSSDCFCSTFHFGRANAFSRTTFDTLQIWFLNSHLNELNSCLHLHHLNSHMYTHTLERNDRETDVIMFRTALRLFALCQFFALFSLFSFRLSPWASGFRPQKPLFFLSPSKWCPPDLDSRMDQWSWFSAAPRYSICSERHTINVKLSV